MTKKGKQAAENEQLALLLEEAATNGSKRGERYPGRKFFGYFCSYWPEELVLAAGLEPLRILPPPGNATPAELPSYCCSLARGSLALAARGSFNDLAGVGFAHTCDTMQCLGGIWGETINRESTLEMVPPVTLNAPGAFRYYKKELINLLNQLGQLSGRTARPEDISRSLELCQRIRLLAAQLDEMRLLLPSPLVSALLRAGQVMPRREYAVALEASLPALKEMAADPGNRPKVLITGPVLENDSLFKMVEDLGGRVVADDTCSGFHHFTEPPATEQSDPLEAVVHRYTGMPLCPCRHRGLEERMNYLEKLGLSRQARGAIILIRKFCEPHGWDAVPLANRLQKAGIRPLVLELEGAEVGGQERTRLQAFLENV